MSPPDLVFKVEYNVSEGDSASNYKQFIENVRSHNQLITRYVRNRPVLSQLNREANDIKWFHVVLKATDQNGVAHHITLRIRTDTLYLDAYQTENGQWFEFANLIEGSRRLGFRSDYGDQLGQIQIGREPLVNAISYLTTSNNDNRDRTRRQLMVLYVMICEAIRFNSISHVFIANLLSRSTQVTTQLDGYGQNEQIDGAERARRSTYMSQITGWGNLSEEVLQTDAIGGHSFSPFPNMDITTFQTAITALGMLRFYCWPGDKHYPPSEVTEEECGAGRPLMEVYHLVISNIDGENPGDLYGTIKVTDAMGSQYIYNRSRSDFESIYPGDHATLNGPSHVISALDTFMVDFDLKDKDADFSPDDEIVRELFPWNFYDLENVYDTIISRGVSGKYGNASFVYAVLNNAVAATIRITLINGDGENPANVYGNITAHTSKFEGNQIVLFNKGSSNYVDVRPGELIVLLRSVVAVTLGSSLVIDAKLWDQDSFSPDDEVANDTATFPAKISGTSEQDILGRYGRIKVTINWE